MIKTENQKNPSSILEQLRVTSETLSDEQVLKLFEGAAKQIYTDIVHSTAQNLVDITEIEKNGNDGLVLIVEIIKAVKIEPFDSTFLDSLLKKSVGLALPDWMKSQDAIVKAKKVTALKKLKNSLNKNYCNINLFVEDFISLFDITEYHPAAINFRNSFNSNLSYKDYMSGRSFLEHNGSLFITFLNQLTKNRNLLNKPITIYFSLSTGNLSRIDDGNSFIVADLDLKVSEGTMNTLMSSLRKKDSNPVEVIKKIISSGLKKKYLHLSKNSSSFDNFKKRKSTICTSSK